jgi:hypothetical protein
MVPAQAPPRATLVALLLVLSLAAACSNTSGQPLPATNGSAVFFVERHPKDERDLALLIADALREHGLNATSGSPSERPDQLDFLVTYEDRWQWDMRMYLIRLRINVRDPETQEILGYGESYQDSLSAMGDTFRDVIDRALGELLDQQAGEQLPGSAKVVQSESRERARGAASGS